MRNIRFKMPSFATAIFMNECLLVAVFPIECRRSVIDQIRSKSDVRFGRMAARKQTVGKPPMPAVRPDLGQWLLPTQAGRPQPNQAIPVADVQGDHVRVASRPRTSFRSIIKAPESSHCQRIGNGSPWINSVSKVRCPFTGGRQFYCCHTQ
jgi:hypothetical protein